MTLGAQALPSRHARMREERKGLIKKHGDKKVQGIHSHEKNVRIATSLGSQAKNLWIRSTKNQEI